MTGWWRKTRKPVMLNELTFFKTGININSMALACERTMPDEQQLLVGEVVPTSCRIEGVVWSA
jgi:hypothetical protein